MTPEDAQVGMAVVYRAHPDARPEDGQITSLHALDRGIVHVLYAGDTTPKATRLVDLVRTTALLETREHEHETWQLQPHADGGHYCAACGARVEAAS